MLGCLGNGWSCFEYSWGIFSLWQEYSHFLQKLCRLVNEFGRIYERRKLRVNVVNSKVMRCSRYGNGDRMHVIINGEPLEEVDCFKGFQVTADGGYERDVVHRMNNW